MDFKELANKHICKFNNVATGKSVIILTFQIPYYSQKIIMFVYWVQTLVLY